MAAYRIEIDCRKTRMTMAAMMQTIQKLQAENPDREYYMDGDCFSIVSKERPKQTRQEWKEVE